MTNKKISRRRMLKGLGLAAAGVAAAAKLDGLDKRCCIEAVSCVVKTVKDRVCDQDIVSMDREHIKA